MDNLAKAIPFIAIAALVCGVVGLILGILAFQKSSQIDEIATIKDANSTISGSIASLQEEMSGLSKKYTTVANLKEFANSTQSAFNTITEQLTKLRTQSRTDSIKIAELETKLAAGVTSRPVTTPVDTSSMSVSSSTVTPDDSDVTSTVPAGGGEEYMIQSGDTLGKVASSFGITLDKLLAANPGVQPRYLRVGQKILIPE